MQFLRNGVCHGQLCGGGDPERGPESTESALLARGQPLLMESTVCRKVCALCIFSLRGSWVGSLAQRLVSGGMVQFLK